MKILMLLTFILISGFCYSQPCKTVRPGMTREEIIKVAGAPTEVYSMGVAEGDSLIMWHYGDTNLGNEQRVTILGDKVIGEVISNGKLYDQLMASFKAGEFPKEELIDRVQKMNREQCK